MRGSSRLAVSAAVLAGLLGAIAAPASADVPIESFGIAPGSTQAGGHPDLQVAFAIRNGKKQQVDPGINSPCDCENARFVTVHAPPGLVGNPHATPQCTSAQFTSYTCPVDSQVGVVEAGISLTPVGAIPQVAPIYNMVPRQGEAGLLAFQVIGTPIFEVFSARTGSDYGLDTKISVWNGLPVATADQVLWGVPADESHDALRWEFGASSVFNGTLCDVHGVTASPYAGAPNAPLSGPDSIAQLCPGATTHPGGHASNSPPIPFLENPTSCGTPLQAELDVLAWDGGSTSASAPFPATTGCDQLTFNPSLAASPTSASADSPSGMDVNLTVPQPQSRSVPSPSEIRGTEMILPEGFTVNPSAADGKSACTDAEARFGSEEQAQCPETAKIGTLEIETALLPGLLPGYVYLGRPLPGNRYRIFLVADGFNVHVKLAGTIRPDLRTGRVAVIFTDLPQTPFERFTLHIFGSERGSLATPTRCGSYDVSTRFTPWNSALPDQTSKQTFTIDSGPNGAPCPGATRPFGPSFDGGSAGNSPGAHSSFAVDLTRPDGDQFLTGLTVKTPAGFAANLNGVPYCPEAALALLGNALYSGLSELTSSACPAASQIGTVSAGAGAGSRPFYAPGKVYLAGPYKGAPLSLAVVVPAVSGPYDLGNVVARAAIEVNPTTARVTTVSDPLPQILEGIPLRTRHVRVNIDRPKFALNPTNCNPHAVEATITGDEGAVAMRSTHYQVANCAILPFAPKLSLKLAGPSRRAGHPALTATLTARPGGANIARAVVAMPHAEFLDQAHIGTVCTRVQFAAEKCPQAAIYGFARAFTPILDRPLEGPVYLRSSNHQLPDLVADLHGQVDFELAGRVDSVDGGIRTSFEGLPDVPVSKFVLSMQGGAKGLLQNSRNICKGKAPRASMQLSGQNGRLLQTTVPLRATCGKVGKKRSRHGAPQRSKVER